MNFKIKAHNLYLNGNSVLHTERAIDQRLSGWVDHIEGVSLYLSKKQRLLDRKIKQYQCKLIVKLVSGEYVRVVSKHDDLRFAIDDALRKAAELIECKASALFQSKDGAGLESKFGFNGENRVHFTEVAYSI